LIQGVSDTQPQRGTRALPPAAHGSSGQEASIVSIPLSSIARTWAASIEAGVVDAAGLSLRNPLELALAPQVGLELGEYAEAATVLSMNSRQRNSH
jgi:hypothetical protein